MQGRLSGPGKRWEPDGGAADVALREIHSSHDWQDFCESDPVRLLDAA